VADTVFDLVVEVDRSADKGQVAKGLREIAELLAGAADLLGIQAEVIGVSVHLLKNQSRVVEPPGAGEGVNVPERAQGEGALITGQPVG